jgi:hypothetical protein
VAAESRWRQRRSQSRGARRANFPHPDRQIRHERREGDGGPATSGALVAATLRIGREGSGRGLASRQTRSDGAVALGRRVEENDP